MTAAEIVEQLKPLGLDSYKKVLKNHGIPEPMFGVKIEELKKFQKRIKKDYQLALDLYDTGIYDAMYLAGPDRRRPQDDQEGPPPLGREGELHALCEYTVPWVAAESKHGRELALEWIESAKESVAAAGWATLSSLVAIKDDADLDLPELKQLLQRVQKTIHHQPNRVRHAMNGFVIAVGSYVTRAHGPRPSRPRTKIGPVTVDMGGTACKVPFAPEYIQKVQETRGHREETQDGEMLTIKGQLKGRIYFHFQESRWVPFILDYPRSLKTARPVRIEYPKSGQQPGNVLRVAPLLAHAGFVERPAIPQQGRGAIPSSTLRTSQKRAIVGR